MSNTSSVVSYLTQEIQELIRLGAVHAFTWVRQNDPGCWMQVSVHDGNKHYLTVLCVLPPHIKKEQLDKLLGIVGRKQSQVNQGTCVIYYLIPSDSHDQLLSQAPVAAGQCAAIVGLLWNASDTEQFELLGARGPRIPLYGGARQSIPSTKTTAKTVIREASLPAGALPEPEPADDADDLEAS